MPPIAAHATAHATHHSAAHAAHHPPPMPPIPAHAAHAAHWIGEHQVGHRIDLRDQSLSASSGVVISGRRCG